MLFVGKECGTVQNACLGFDGGPAFDIVSSGFVLFGDAQLNIRRVEVFDRPFSKSEAASCSRTLGWFLPESVRSMLLRINKERGAAFSLSGILSRPSPCWKTGCFHGIFLDRFMATGYGNDHDVHHSLRALAFLGPKVLLSDHAIVKSISQTEKGFMSQILAGLKNSVDLARKVATVSKQKNHARSIYNLLNFLREKLSNIKPGAFLIVPVGVYNHTDHDIVLLVRCLDKEKYEITVVNPCGETAESFHSMKPNSLPYKSKHLTSFLLGQISKERVLDMSWWLWLLIFRCVRAEKNNFQSFYEVIGWLRNEPFDVTVDMWEEGISETTQPSDFRSVPMSFTTHYKVVTESFYFLCRRYGVLRSSVKAFFAGLRLEMFECVRRDLLQVQIISRSEKKIIEIGIQQMCFNILKYCENLSDHSVKSTLLADAFKRGTSIANILDSKQEASDYATCKTVLELGQGICKDAQSSLFPLFDSFLSDHDLQGLGDGEMDFVSGLQEDLLHDKLERVKSFDDAIHTIRRTLRVFFVLEAQQDRVRLSNRLILLIAERMFTFVLPTPLGPLTRKITKRKCIWSCACILAQQKEAVDLLASLSFHIVSAASGLEWDEHFHMLFTSILGSIAAIADAILRTDASDSIGGVTRALKSGFFVSSELFEAQAAVFPVYCANLLTLRAGVLDYFR